jgi:elongator complex protein 4
MRKRLIFETLHLDLEGGVGERRTTPSTNAMALDVGMTSHESEHGVEMQRKAKIDAIVHVEVEVGAEESKAEVSPVGAKVKKSKKKVAFQSDRPDLYDF